eukprot:2041718-Prymnesium_polylepis.1
MARPPPARIEPTVFHSVYVTMIAAGDVSNFDASMRAEVAAVFAQAANVSDSDVVVTVAAGSVIVSTKIRTASASAASALTSYLSTALATPTAATAFFAEVSGGVTVESTPTVEASSEMLRQPPYPPGMAPRPPPPGPP